MYKIICKDRYPSVPGNSKDDNVAYNKKYTECVSDLAMDHHTALFTISLGQEQNWWLVEIFFSWFYRWAFGSKLPNVPGDFSVHLLLSLMAPTSLLWLPRNTTQSILIVRCGIPFTFRLLLMEKLFILEYFCQATWQFGRCQGSASSCVMRAGWKSKVALTAIQECQWTRSPSSFRFNHCKCSVSTDKLAH